jgi:hypothetical protein
MATAWNPMDALRCDIDCAFHNAVLQTNRFFAQLFYRDDQPDVIL